MRPSAPWRSCARGTWADLAASLRDEEAFARGHMLTWVDDFARCARRSKTAVLYPQMIEALAAFVRNDAVVLSEAACWTEEARAACGETIPGRSRRPSGAAPRPPPSPRYPMPWRPLPACAPSASKTTSW